VKTRIKTGPGRGELGSRGLDSHPTATIHLKRGERAARKGGPGRTDGTEDSRDSCGGKRPALGVN